MHILCIWSITFAVWFDNFLCDLFNNTLCVVDFYCILYYMLPFVCSIKCIFMLQIEMICYVIIATGVVSFSHLGQLSLALSKLGFLF